MFFQMEGTGVHAASELRLNGISPSSYAELMMSVEGRSCFLAI